VSKVIQSIKGGTGVSPLSYESE